jgi:hypothetical protein
VENLWKSSKLCGSSKYPRIFHRRPQALKFAACGKVENFYQITVNKGLILPPTQPSVWKRFLNSLNKKARN